MRKKLSISVLVITWNEKHLLSRCLEKLCANFDFDEDEIVVIDNGSIDDTPEMVSERFPSVRYYRLEENIGVGPARNRGIMVADKDIVMTLDNDAYLATPFSTLKASIIDAHLHNPNLGVMGFRLCFPDGSYQFNGRGFPGFVQPFYSRIPFLRSIKYFKNQYNSHLNVNLEQISTGLHEVDYLLGANQIFTREWLVKTGIYDESIFFGPEDLEFCWRVKQAGGQNMINMSVSIIHDYQRRTRKINKIFFLHTYAFYRTWLKMKSLWR